MIIMVLVVVAVQDINFKFEFEYFFFIYNVNSLLALDALIDNNVMLLNDFIYKRKKNDNKE